VVYIPAFTLFQQPLFVTAGNWLPNASGTIKNLHIQDTTTAYNQIQGPTWTNILAAYNKLIRLYTGNLSFKQISNNDDRETLLDITAILSTNLQCITCGDRKQELAFDLMKDHEVPTVVVASAAIQTIENYSGYGARFGEFCKVEMAEFGDTYENMMKDWIIDQVVPTGALYSNISPMVDEKATPAAEPKPVEGPHSEIQYPHEESFFGNLFGKRKAIAIWSDKDVADLKRMVANEPGKFEHSKFVEGISSFLPVHGNFGGPNYSAGVRNLKQILPEHFDQILPKDEEDRLYAYHDVKIQIATDQKDVRKADDELVDDLQKLKKKIGLSLFGHAALIWYGRNKLVDQEERRNQA